MGFVSEKLCFVASFRSTSSALGATGTSWLLHGGSYTTTHSMVDCLANHLEWHTIFKITLKFFAYASQHTQLCVTRESLLAFLHDMFPQMQCFDIISICACMSFLCDEV